MTFVAPSARRLLPLLLVLLLPACGSGGGLRDEDDVCELVVSAFGDNDPQRLVALLPDETAAWALERARIWEGTDSGASRIGDDAIRGYYLGQAEAEWKALAAERSAARARRAQSLARTLDQVRELLDRPRRRDLEYRRFRERTNTERYGERHVAEAEILSGTIRFRSKKKDFACDLRIAEIDRRWYLLDLEGCRELLPEPQGK